MSARQEAEAKLDDVSSNLRSQLKSKEEELMNLTSVHTAAVAAYDRRVAELELKVARLTEANKQLELRRHLDCEGWTADVTVLRKMLTAVDRKLHEMRLVERLEDDDRLDTILKQLRQKAPKGVQLPGRSPAPAQGGGGGEAQSVKSALAEGLQDVQMAGASAGSLAVATYNCGLDPEKATKALHEFAANCRENGTRYRLGGLLRDFLHAYLPDDAHERCRGNTHVALTRLFPVVRNEMISEFESKDDFVNALLTSCHIPFYFNGSWMTEFRGRFYMDGGVAAFIPRPPTEYAVKVCCFPVSEVLATVQDRVAQYDRVASLLDVSISPDAYEPWPFNYAQMVTWALVPADDDMLRYMINKGRKDGRAWAQRMQLVPGDAAAGRSGGEGAGDIGGGAERAAERVRVAQERRDEEHGGHGAAGDGAGGAQVQAGISMGADAHKK
ncbi:hypothetical protein GPECTOR_70g485 [Gonium pectorale]|uniref:Patatin n=1 Tax=Gonium pectorale TaxID=33097 RepID=A0A150G360_GONPE|nr:hypothetical protein GPECTOR_70g485 [Gonium pectorale]|eukprot:KXZ44254.1 hypothetical protein GPECTOR_70g485 [Gonium pectorale]